MCAMKVKTDPVKKTLSSGMGKKERYTSRKNLFQNFVERIKRELIKKNLWTST